MYTDRYREYSSSHWLLFWIALPKNFLGKIWQSMEIFIKGIKKHKILIFCVVSSGTVEESTKWSAMNTTHKLLSIGMRFSSVQTVSGLEAERQRRLMTDHNSTAGECWTLTYQPPGCNTMDIPTSGASAIDTLHYVKNMRSSACTNF